MRRWSLQVTRDNTKVDHVFTLLTTRRVYSILFNYIIVKYRRNLLARVCVRSPGTVDLSLICGVVDIEVLVIE